MIKGAEHMYFVPDDTKKCGYYECPECGMRFLSVHLEEELECPYCERDVDLEIGPDEEMTDAFAKAKLIRVIEEEDIEKWDKLLSLAITGGDDEDWL